MDTERTSSAVLERSAADALRDKLAADDPGEVRYALGLLEGQRTQSWHPALRALLQHPAAGRRGSARWRCWPPPAITRSARDAVALLHDPDLGVRTEALLYLSRERGIDPLAQIETLGDFADFSIRAGMAAFLASPGPAQNLDAARAILEAMAHAEGAGRRPRAGRSGAAHRAGAGASRACCRALLADPDLEVVAAGDRDGARHGARRHRRRR